MNAEKTKLSHYITKMCVLNEHNHIDGASLVAQYLVNNINELFILIGFVSVSYAHIYLRFFFLDSNMVSSRPEAK